MEMGRLSLLLLVVLCMTCSVNAALNDQANITMTETQALKSLCSISCTDPDGVEELRSYNWCNFSIPYCSWDGITCLDHNKTITILMIGNRRVSSVRYRPLFCGPLPEEISRVKSIEKMYLLNNRITSIPGNIHEMESLILLRIEYNEIETLPRNLSKSNLVQIVMSSNPLSGFPNALCEMENLKYLYASDCGLKSVPKCIGNSKAMRTLSLGNNEIGELPDELCKIQSLSSIILSMNRLERLPDCMGNLTNLKHLSLTNNYIAELPPSFSSLQKLSYFAIVANQLRDITVLGQLNSLSRLLVNQNMIRNLPVMSNWTKMTSLSAIDNFLESVPNSIKEMKSLAYVDLAYNRISSLPDLSECVSLEHLYMSNNILTTLPDNIGELPFLSDLEISENILESLPNSIGNLTELTILSLASNLLSRLPDTISQLVNIHMLDLSFNPWLREIPSTISSLSKLSDFSAEKCSISTMPNWFCEMKDLQRLNLISNSLTSIPDCIGKLTLMRTMDFDHNRIGKIPDSICELKNVVRLNFQENRLTAIPDCIDKLSGLRSMFMYRNKLTAIPNSIGNMRLEKLDIGSNRIRTLPSSIGNIMELQDLRVTNNLLTELPDSLCTVNPHLKVVECGNNKIRSLPNSFKHCKEITDLFISKNPLMEIPSVVFSLTALSKLEMADTGISSIPNGITNLSSLKYLDISLNSVTRLPTGFFSELKNLEVFQAPRNSIQYLGSHCNETILENVKFFDVSDSPVGCVPYNMSKLELLIMKNCSLKEMRPESLCSDTLRFADISHNNIKTLRNHLDDCSNLAVLQAQNNKLEFTPRLNELNGLRILDLSNNNLKESISSLLRSLKSLPNLATLILDNSTDSSISQRISSKMVRSLSETGFHTGGDETSFPALNSLNMANNRIFGALSNFPYRPWWIVKNMKKLKSVLQTMPNLVDLDLTNNEIYGAFPTQGKGAALDLSPQTKLLGYPINYWLNLLSNIRLQGNAKMQDASDSLPNDLAFDKTKQQLHVFPGLDGQEVSEFTCFATVGAARSFTIQIDPSYYNYEGCTCATGYFGTPPYCFACPHYPVEVARCENGQLLLERGWWAPGGQSGKKISGVEYRPPLPSQLVKCPSVSMSSSDCLGTGTNGTFQCAEHTSGRFCSQCQDGYFRSGMTCKSCDDKAQWVTIIVLSLFAMILLALSSFKRTSSGATIKIFVFYCQTLWIFMPRVSSWELGSATEWIVSALGIGSGVTLFGIECLSPMASSTSRYALRFFVMASLPFIVVLTVPLMMMIFYRFFSKKKFAWSHSVSPTLFLLLYLYIPCSNTLLSPLSVAEEELPSREKVQYLINAPWIQSSSPIWKNSIQPVAILGTILFTFCFPVGLSILMWRKRGNIRNTEYLNILWRTYKPSMSAFELIVLIRRVVIVLAVSLLQFDSLWVPIIIFITVLTALMLQMGFAPYGSRTDNAFEIVSLVVILVTYLGGVMENTQRAGSEENIEWLIVVINSVLMIAFIVKIVREIAKRAGNVAEKSMDIVLQKYSTSKRLRDGKFNGGIELGLQESQVPLL